VDRKQFLHRPSRLLPSLPSLCPRAVLLLALAPALPFAVYMGASLGSPSPRGSQGRRATSLSPGLPEGQRVSPKRQQGAQHPCSRGREHTSPSKAVSPKRRVSICLVLTVAVPQHQYCLSPQSRRHWDSAYPTPLLPGAEMMLAAVCEGPVPPLCPGCPLLGRRA